MGSLLCNGGMPKALSNVEGVARNLAPDLSDSSYPTDSSDLLFTSRPTDHHERIENGHMGRTFDNPLRMPLESQQKTVGILGMLQGLHCTIGSTGHNTQPVAETVHGLMMGGAHRDLVRAGNATETGAAQTAS